MIQHQRALTLESLYFKVGSIPLWSTVKTITRGSIDAVLPKAEGNSASGH